MSDKPDPDAFLQHKEELLEKLEDWFQSLHPSDEFNPLQTTEMPSLGIKSLAAIGMCDDEIIQRLEGVGLDPDFESHNGFKLWQLALMFGREELANTLHEQCQPQKKRPRTRK